MFSTASLKLTNNHVITLLSNVIKIQHAWECIKVYKLTENLLNVSQNGLRTTLGV